MTLRVEDLKPGDVVRMDLVISASNSIAQGYWRLATRPVDLKDEDGFIIVDQEDLAAGNAERVVRPRPVRKGDEVRRDDGLTGDFVGSWCQYAVVVVARKTATVCDPTFWTPSAMTHADGSPIDWEASE